MGSLLSGIPLQWRPPSIAGSACICGHFPLSGFLYQQQQCGSGWCGLVFSAEEKFRGTRVSGKCKIYVAAVPFSRTSNTSQDEWGKIGCYEAAILRRRIWARAFWVFLPWFCHAISPLPRLSARGCLEESTWATTWPTSAGWWPQGWAGPVSHQRLTLKTDRGLQRPEASEEPLWHQGFCWSPSLQPQAAFTLDLSSMT